MAQEEVQAELRTKATAAAEAIYRLTEVSAFDAALKFSLRRSAADIISAVAGFGVSVHRRRRLTAERLVAASAGIQELIRFAAAKRMMAPGHAELVISAYERIRECALAYAASEVSRPGASAGGRQLNDRQRRILEYLATAGQAQISDIRQLFGQECSGKTLQRDLWQLVNDGRVQKQGDNRWTVYTPFSIGH